MEILRYTAPFDCQPFLKVLEDEFGIKEALLEQPQLNGSEQEHNLDFVFVAKEGEEILGTIHATIPKADPTLCGLSAMCTTPAARGKGLGRILFGKIVEEAEALGAETMLLGTGNPIAAKLYGSFGFSYLPGSFVMARFAQGGEIDFTRRTFAETPKQLQILPGSARMRIPLIPLVLYKGSQILLDCNTNFVSCKVLSQKYCMSLFPRYLSIREQGGDFYGAYSEKGVLGAVASVMPTERGNRADFFCCDSFEAAIPGLLQKCEADFGNCYLQIAKDDLKKQQIAAQCGFTQGEELLYSWQGVQIPCYEYRHS